MRYLTGVMMVKRMLTRNDVTIHYTEDKLFVAVIQIGDNEIYEVGLTEEEAIKRLEILVMDSGYNV